MNDDKENFEALKKAAESGDENYYIALGKRYLEGKGTDKDFSQAFYRLKKPLRPEMKNHTINLD